VSCPDCGCGRLDLRQHAWVEPHGEPCRQEWWQCPECGAKYEDAELEEAYRDLESLEATNADVDEEFRK